ncbi:MAG: 1-aminocyclopropane-1-carboxylate deaminase/D-cysteine desulfhydrase [Bacteroidales bacterium]
MTTAIEFPGRAVALSALNAIPCVKLAHYPTPVEEMGRLRNALGGGPRLLVKRDDAISFGFGGNKVRKVEVVAAEAIAAGADTLITTGGGQSNHARVTAAAAAKLGMRCVLVLNGEPPSKFTGNALLDDLYGAEIHYVARREERAPAMTAIAERLRSQGRRPVEIPLGASTPLGAIGVARAVGELVDAGVVPDVIVHATSSGGTQAGLVAGCALHGLPTRVLGISADTPREVMKEIVRALLGGMGTRIGLAEDALARFADFDVDDTFVGEGYAVPTPASREAMTLAARTEAIVVDHTYTAKALAGLIAYVRAGTFSESQAILFWHTGGQVAIFA